MKQTQKTAFFKRRKKFTLIELLITIAIIAILAAMLLPVLNSAREKANTISCSGNFKQFALALANYTSDFNDFYPPCRASDPDADPGYKTWSRYFVLGGKYLTAKTLLCPSAKKDMGGAYLKVWENGLRGSVNASDWMFANIAINKAAVSDVTPRLKTTKVKNASRFLTATEAKTENSATSKSPFYRVHCYPEWANSAVYPRHNTSAVNVSWGDGHVTTVYGRGYTPQTISESFYAESGPFKKQWSMNNVWSADGMPF